MTSSDGFYSPPYWHTPETSTVPSQRASVPSGHEGTGQPHTGGPQVDKQSSWTQVPGKACSDEQSVIHESVTPSRHDYLQLTEAVLSPTQNCQTGAQLDVPYLPPVCSNYNPVEVQDGQVGFDRVPRTPEASTTYSLHSVLSLPEGGIDGEAVHPEPDKDFSASVEEECQDPLSTSADSPQNGCLQLTDAIVCHTLHPHTVDIPESFSQSPEHNSGQVSSDRSNTPVQLQEVLGSNRSPKTHSADEAFNLDPVIDAGLSPQPPLGPRSLTETSEALEACSSVGEHGETALLSREVDSNGEIFQPAPDEVTAGDSVEVPLPTSAAECPSEGTVQNVSLEQAGGVAWHTHTVDTHAASAPDVCGLPSPSLEHNSGSVCSDYVLVELHDGNALDSAPITHTADINLGLNPVMTRDLLVASEAAAGVSSPEEHGEPAVFVGDVDTEAEKAAQPLPDKVTAADSVEENSSKSCLFTSANAELGVCQKETLGSLTPSTLEPLSNPANSNETRPDSESWTKCVPPTDFQVAADTTDTSAKEKQTQTGCCDTQLQNNHQQSQASADPSESAGLPYSLRRRRRGATTTTSSSADSSSAPVSAKRSCPGLVQSCSSIPTPEEGCSQEAPSALTVPVKRKRGRPRKIKQPVDLNEVSSTASVAAEKAESKPLVSESPVTQDCLEETPDTSLSTRRHLKRKAAEAAATSSSAVGGETEGQGNTDSPLDPPLTLSTDAQQSQLLSQEPELAEAPSSDLSFEQILQDDPMPLTPLSLPEEEEMEEEDPEDEEELPSILERKPLSITEGLCVWCKFRKYPFWPAVVKSVNHKNKKASIVFIDTFLIDEKGIRKGLTVSLKTLKPLDCEDAEELTEQARQQYGEAITWCLELIYDYRIRIGCGSFSGSFIEYFASDISCPLRQNYSQGTSDLTFPTQLIVDDLFESSEEDGVGEQVEGQQCKKLLPDRAKAARTRANEKLVDFIVRKRGAEKRLLAVIGGQDTSKWLRALQKASRFVVDPYLEDEEQVDQVYRYLDELLRRSPQTLPCLAHLERIPLILDVLLPEALICAIAGVDDISLEQAEEKYRKGPCISKRERQEFNMRIEQLMKTLNQCKQVL